MKRETSGPRGVFDHTDYLRGEIPIASHFLVVPHSMLIIFKEFDPVEANILNTTLTEPTPAAPSEVSEPLDVMPVFVLKAKDNLALGAIDAYRKACQMIGDYGQAEQVELAMNEILKWRARNPFACKYPDHNHAPAGTSGSGSETPAPPPSAPAPAPEPAANKTTQSGTDVGIAGRELPPRPRLAKVTWRGGCVEWATVIDDDNVRLCDCGTEMCISETGDPIIEIEALPTTASVKREEVDDVRRENAELRNECAEKAMEILRLKKPRMFPLQTSRDAPPGPRQIPWSVAEIAYGEYSRRYGSSQTLERLAERGGFGWCEMDTFHPAWRNEVSELSSLRTELEQAQRRVMELTPKRIVGDGSHIPPDHLFAVQRKGSGLVGGCVALPFCQTVRGDVYLDYGTPDFNEGGNGDGSVS
jgi:hypothetical protein